MLLKNVEFAHISCYLALEVRIYVWFQDLVEHNPLIAVEVLSKLINSPDISGYVSFLCHMFNYRDAPSSCPLFD
jgi:hypothetical protein